MKKYLLKILFPLFLHTQAQIDSNYIGSFNKDFSFYFYLTNKANTIYYTNTKNKYQLIYQPNSWSIAGFGGSYKFIDISAAVLNIGKLDEKKYGYTQRLDLQSHLYLRKYILDIVFQTYTGLYSINQEIIPDKQYSYIREDLNFFNFGINFLRVINSNKFSIKAAYSFSEKQLKPTSTWIYGLRIGYFNLNGDSSFIPQKLNNYYTGDFNLIKFSSTQTGIIGGYMKNWLYKKWIFNTSILIGFINELQFKELKSKPGINYAHSTFGEIANIRLSAGYNTNNKYFYISSIFENCSYHLSQNYQINHLYGRIDIVYGFRL